MFPKNYKPMLLKEVDFVPGSKDYIYELKYDGIRAIIYVTKTKIKIITRNGNDVTKLYPELETIKDIAKNNVLVLDGEIVAFKDGKPSFSELQKRSHLKDRNKILEMEKNVPVAFIAFDILYKNKDLTDRSLLERKKALDIISDTNYFIKTKIYQDGKKLFERVKKLGLEGIVAKKKNSIYIGKRVDYWVKIKNFKEEEFYVGGYILRKEKISFLLGEKQNGKFIYVGKVSIMKNDKLAQIIQEKEVEDPFYNYKDDGHFLKPKYKLLVSYMERTTNNTLRQPFLKK